MSRLEFWLNGTHKLHEVEGTFTKSLGISPSFNIFHSVKLEFSAQVQQTSTCMQLVIVIQLMVHIHNFVRSVVDKKRLKELLPNR